MARGRKIRAALRKAKSVSKGIRKSARRLVRPHAKVAAMHIKTRARAALSKAVARLK